MTKERGGFTLIEVIVALTVLLAVMVGFVTMTGKTTNVAATTDRQESAIQLVSDRIDQIRSDPNYAHLDSASLYVTTESNFPTLPGFQRVTQIVRTTTNGNDYKRITVTVTGPGLSSAVARTVTVGAQ